MTPSTLVEHVADWHAELQVDRLNRLVRNVALTGGLSRNGYHYTEQALQDAVPLYNQRPVFLDHAADKSRPQERSTRDLAGSIINPRYESGRIRGDIRLDTDSGARSWQLRVDAAGRGHEPMSCWRSVHSRTERCPHSRRHQRRRRRIPRDDAELSRIGRRPGF
ncbi:MAG: hypothetical protein KF861_08830 [Planctomycetaceae bacterium]|nr:hypothetical protein [Planctomycetaceae bacterium]